ncbi:MAG: histidine phosphatase family protein [Alphaproteobacteria bacterium]|nr:histidine phosphatase family protein [Alphaproteobacteria bacterium]
MKKIFLITGLILTVLSAASATPKKVVIIRHAEKIQGGKDLNLQGYKRAGALPYYFSGTPIYNDPAPRHIFAAALDEADSSVRPIQTCTPIANYFKVPLNIEFKHTETDQLAQEILKNPKYDGSTVLVCWSHGHIRPLVLALGGEDPGKWNADIFDQVYLLTFEDSTQPKLQKILQKLMFGDRASFTD